MLLSKLPAANCKHFNLHSQSHAELLRIMQAKCHQRRMDGLLIIDCWWMQKPSSSIKTCMVSERAPISKRGEDEGSAHRDLESCFRANASTSCDGNIQRTLQSSHCHVGPRNLASRLATASEGAGSGLLFSVPSSPLPGHEDILMTGSFEERGMQVTFSCQWASRSPKRRMGEVIWI